MCHADWKGKVATICWKSPNNLANVLEASSHVPCQGSKFKEKCSRIFATSWEKLVPKHKLILKIMDRRLPVMMTSQIFLARTNPDFDRSNNEYYIFFLAFAILNCTGNRLLYCIDFQVFGGKLVKNSFTHFWVPFQSFHTFSCPFIYALSIIVWRCLKSHKVHPISAYLWNLSFFIARQVIEKSPPQRKETSLIIFGKEVDLARNLFHKQCIYHQKSINIQQSFHLGHRAALFLEGLINKQEGGF